jgi:hypothetical protein
VGAGVAGLILLIGLGGPYLRGRGAAGEQEPQTFPPLSPPTLAPQPQKPGIIRLFLFGILWAYVFYLVACFVVGFVIGFREGAGLAPKTGGQASVAAVESFQVYLLFGAVSLATIGAGFGLLPGTRGGKKRGYNH